MAFLILSIQGCSEVEGGKKTEPVEADSQALLAANEVAEIDIATIKEGEVFQTLCASCHGVNGEGNELLKSPSIGGLPGWYVKEQIDKFRKGWRGTNPEDISGQLMRASVMALSSAQVEEASVHNEKLTPVKTVKQGDKASLDRGRYIFANECMACHRFSGSGEIVFHSAPLTTLNREYLIRQMESYRKGWRGNHPSDFYGQKMVVISETLSDQSIEDLVNFIGSLAHGDDPRPAMER